MTSSVREVLAGDARFAFPSDELAAFVDSSDLVDDAAALARQLDSDGYLYLPGFLDRDAVLRARSAILDEIERQGAIAPGTVAAAAMIDQDGPTPRLMGRRDITHHPDVRSVLDSDRLHALMAAIHGERALGFDFAWLRAVGTREYTGVHLDRVYMGRGSERLTTAWVPLGDIPLEMGSLCVCPGSHRDPRFARLHETYGRLDVDRDRTEGWFTTDPSELSRAYDAVWHTGDVAAGDVVVFGMGLLHASTTNCTDRWRISCDVRFQPAVDPVDERWVGSDPPGHDPATFDPELITTMAEARARWGV